MNDNVLNVLNLSAIFLSNQVELSYKYFLKDNPNIETQLEFIIYTQYKLFDSMLDILPNFHEILKENIHKNLEYYIHQFNLTDKLPYYDLEELLDDRYETYEDELYSMSLGERPYPINIIRNLFYTPLQFQKATTDDVDFESGIKKYIEFSYADKILQKSLNNTLIKIKAEIENLK